MVTSPPYNILNSDGGSFPARHGAWDSASLRNGYADHDDCMPHGEYVEWQRIAYLK